MYIIRLTATRAKAITIDACTDATIAIAVIKTALPISKEFK
tara:strand:+ start:471 stop:593 length:123 start_codon:yes stop_codon:yes gene_type:complete